MIAKYQTNKKALVYARESRDDYGEKYERIETQRDILLEFCQKNGITNIIDVIMDDNMSGTSFERLNEIKRMMADGEIDIFICKDASRLGRNLLESLKFIEFAEENNVEIMFESEVFDPEIFPLIAWFNERRAKDDSVKIRRVLRHKLENGLVIVPPYGYKKENGDMIPDPDTAPVIKKIFEMAYNRSTPAQIADYLNIIHALSPSEGHSTRRKIVNSIWTRDNVRRILKNPAYMGTHIAGKIEKVSFKSKKYRQVPEDQWIVIPNHHEALVSEEVFNSIQLNLKSFKIDSRKPSINPLSGLMVCGRCGSPILLRSRKGNLPVKYVCSKHNREGLIKDELRENWGCNPHAVYYQDMKDTIMDFVHQFMKDEKFKQEVLGSIDKGNDFDKLKQTIKNLKSQEDNLQKRFDVLYEDRLSGILPDFMFSEKSKPVLESLSKIKSQIEAMTSELEKVQQVDPIERYEQCVTLFYENGVTAEGLKKLFQGIIIYEPGDITTEDKSKYNISDKQFDELLHNGGYLFLQKVPWNTITLGRNKNT